jgi:hypothetical protein
MKPEGTLHLCIGDAVFPTPRPQQRNTATGPSVPLAKVYISLRRGDYSPKPDIIYRSDACLVCATYHDIAKGYEENRQRCYKRYRIARE